MINKNRLWNRFETWEQAESDWDQGAADQSAKSPIKSLKKLPKMPGITDDTAKNLKWKAFKYMLSHDTTGGIRRQFLRHPLRYGKQFIKSVFQKQSFDRDGDFFLYNIKSIEAFAELIEDEDRVFVLGFSYCHKPMECPSGRFTDACIHDAEHPVCRQCFIGKAFHALPEKRAIPLCIPTVHYIGEKIFEIVHANPDREVCFIISACEMTLQMFGDWGNMVNIKGLGIRLDGRICNTMRAFELSEEGIKPGLTVVLEDTQKKILELIRHRRETVG